MKPEIVEKLKEMVEPLVEMTGLTLWGLELTGDQSGQVLRIYVDSPAGVSIDQCVSISRQFSLMLDVEDIIPGKYNLEVSSPGLERPFFSVEQMTPHIGEIIDVRLHEPLEGRKKFKGKLLKIDNSVLLIEIDNREFEVDFAAVKKAKLVIEDWHAVTKTTKKKKKK